MGLVSEADLVRKEELRDGGFAPHTLPLRPDDLTKPAAATAGELMSVPAVTVRIDATLPEAARRMARHGVKRLPVVDAQPG
ncbi:hypothetical protein GCM10022206_94500 [Streptomyces chiangmaiensis]